MSFYDRKAVLKVMGKVSYFLFIMVGVTYSYTLVSLLENSTVICPPHVILMRIKAENPFQSLGVVPIKAEGKSEPHRGVCIS